MAVGIPAESESKVDKLQKFTMEVHKFKWPAILKFFIWMFQDASTREQHRGCKPGEPPLISMQSSSTTLSRFEPSDEFDSLDVQRSCQQSLLLDRLSQGGEIVGLEVSFVCCLGPVFRLSARKSLDTKSQSAYRFLLQRKHLRLARWFVRILHTFAAEEVNWEICERDGQTDNILFMLLNIVREARKKLSRLPKYKDQHKIHSPSPSRTYTNFLPRNWGNNSNGMNLCWHLRFVLDFLLIKIIQKLL
jgi:hypothetical protein